VRFIAILLVGLAAACSPQDAAQITPPTPAGTAQVAPLTTRFPEIPTLEQAIAAEPLPSDAPRSEIARLLDQGPDYVAPLHTERPVSHHGYLYERRRSGQWIADVWRNGDGTNEQIGYTNLRTGATFTIARRADGEISNVWIQQRSELEPPLELTSETSTFLGENCTIWRTHVAATPGFQSLNES
jgi:hypothetical protein